MKWEKIDKNISRTAIQGGWLVRDVIELGGAASAFTSSITFVPDSRHQWDIGKEYPLGHHDQLYRK